MDIFTKKKRSEVMSKIRSRNTAPELFLRTALRGNYMRYQPKDILGSPDFGSKKHKIAIFVDGDFWHGYRFPLWRLDVSPFWRMKIGKNRVRDQRNFKKLRRMGWKVIRIWQHQLTCDASVYCDKIVNLIGTDAIGLGARPMRNGRWPS